MGQASFTLKDFLRPFTKELKLRSDVFPLKRTAVDNTENLNLNKTARKNEKAVERFSPYLVNSTFAVIQANLAYPIGSFNMAKELQALEHATLQKALEEEKASQPPHQTSAGKKGEDMSQAFQSGHKSRVIANA